MARRPFIYVLQRSAERLLYEPAATCWARLVLRAWGASVGRGLRVRGHLRLRILGELRIGHDVRLQSGYANYVGADQPMAIWVMPGASVTIGDRCALSNLTIVSQSRVQILDQTFIGGGCRIYDTDFHALDADVRLSDQGSARSAPIRIGPRAFVGAHSIILKGVSIGEGAVIGAGSVVTRNVPPGETWAGVPARMIRGATTHA